MDYICVNYKLIPKVMAKTKVQPPKLDVQMLAGKVGTNPLYKSIKAAAQATDPKKDQDTNNNSNPSNMA